MPLRVRQGCLLPEWEAATVGKLLVLLWCFSSLPVVCVDQKKQLGIKSICVPRPSLSKSSCQSSTLLLEAAHYPQVSLLWTCCNILSILGVTLSLAALFSWRILDMCLPPCPYANPCLLWWCQLTFLHCTGHRANRPGRLGLLNLCESLRRWQDLYPCPKKNHLGTVFFLSVAFTS